MTARREDGEEDSLYRNPIAHLEAPDAILPEQIMAGARQDSYISGEKALMLAILEDGIRCFQEHLRNSRSNPRLLATQAETWIRSVDYEWPFSFNNVCEALGIDPDALRSALLRWKQNQRGLSNEERKKKGFAMSHLRVIDGSGPRHISRSRVRMRPYGHIRLTPKR